MESSPPPAPDRLARLPARELAGGVRIAEARTFSSRVVGLAGLRDLPSGHALLLPRCRSVHTFGMRFGLDLVFLDRHGRVAELRFGVAPGRIVGCRRARAVVEVAQGQGPRVVAALARARAGG